MICTSKESYDRHVWGASHKSLALSETSSSSDSAFTCVPCSLQCVDADALAAHLVTPEHMLKQIRGIVVLALIQ